MAITESVEDCNRYIDLDGGLSEMFLHEGMSIRFWMLRTTCEFGREFGECAVDSGPKLLSRPLLFR